MRQLARVIALRLPVSTQQAQSERLTQAGYLVERKANWLVATKRVSGECDATAGSQPIFWAEGGDRFLGKTSSVARAASSASALRSLPGDFTFLLLRSSGEIVAVRSVAGMVPWYHFSNGEQTAISSHLGDLVEAVLPEAALDAGATAHYAAAAALPGDRTFVRGVRVQTPASIVRVDPAGVAGADEGYWNPTAFTFEAPTRASFERHAEEMRALLRDSCERSLGEGPNLFTVSGGVDSSVLAGLAVNELRARIHTLTFFATDRNVMTRDARYVDGLLGSLGRGVERRFEHRLTDDARMTLLARAPRELGLVRHPPLCILPDLLRETPVETLVGGEFGDAVVGCGPNQDMWMRHVRAKDLARHPEHWAFGLRSSKAWLGFEARHWLRRPRLTVAEMLPPALDPQLGDEYLETRAKWAARCCDDPLGYFTLRRERAAAIAALNWEVTAPLRVARGYPFWTREMLELSLRTHPTELMGRGSKQVLRRAARGLLPRLNLERTDKGHGGVVAPAWLFWRDELPQELAGLVRADWLSRPPDRLPARDALLLRSLVNIVQALRNKRERKACE